MKKTYNIEELKKLSIKVFEQFPESKELYAAVDGNIFVNNNRAQLHVGVKGKFHTIKRSEVIVEKTKTEQPQTLNAQKSISKIAEATNIEEIKVFKDDERKTVKEAYDKKVVELTKSEE